MPQRFETQPASAFADLVVLHRAPRGITVTDAIALVIGYSVAGYVFHRTIFTVHEAGAIGLTIMAVLSFAWLGIACSGPFVLGLRRLQHGRRAKLTPGEAIWVLQGMLWIAVGIARRLRIFDIVTMTNTASYIAATAAAAAPLLCILLWWFERHRAPRDGANWCHRAGILCAAAWPIAWTLAAFLLGV